MPRRTVPLVAGEYYHVYNRGNNRQRIFFDRENYLFFLRRVRELLLGEAEQDFPSSSTDRPFCTIVVYCLMPNHYHPLVCPEDDQFSRHMQRLSISYTKAINKRYGRVGALFQGKFQALRVDRNEYLLHLSRYLHLNPVEAALAKRAQDWGFSSYREYVGLREGTLPRPDVILSQFSTSDGYRRFVESYQPTDKDIISHLLFDEG
jgi:putative transposase